MRTHEITHRVSVSRLTLLLLLLTALVPACYQYERIDYTYHVISEGVVAVPQGAESLGPMAEPGRALIEGSASTGMVLADNEDVRVSGTGNWWAVTQVRGRIAGAIGPVEVGGSVAGSSGSWARAGSEGMSRTAVDRLRTVWATPYARVRLLPPQSRAELSLQAGLRLGAIRFRRYVRGGYEASGGQDVFGTGIRWETSGSYYSAATHSKVRIRPQVDLSGGGWVLHNLFVGGGITWETYESFYGYQRLSGTCLDTSISFCTNTRLDELREYRVRSAGTPHVDLSFRAFDVTVSVSGYTTFLMEPDDGRLPFGARFALRYDFGPGSGGNQVIAR